MDIAHVNSSKKTSNEWKLVEKLVAAGFIMHHGLDMISCQFNTGVTSLILMELLSICKGVNGAKVRHGPRETLWVRILI